MTGFYGKICIKEYLEIEETQVVCFGHPKNIYFMLNSSNIFHCDKSTFPFLLMKLLGAH